MRRVYAQFRDDEESANAKRTMLAPHEMAIKEAYQLASTAGGDLIWAKGTTSYPKDMRNVYVIEARDAMLDAVAILTKIINELPDDYFERVRFDAEAKSEQVDIGNDTPVDANTATAVLSPI